jgi:hypothetical protein
MTGSDSWAPKKFKNTVSERRTGRNQLSLWHSTARNLIGQKYSHISLKYSAHIASFCFSYLVAVTELNVEVAHEGLNKKMN